DSAESGVPLADRDVSVTVDNRVHTVNIVWSFPVIVYRGERVLAIPLSLKRSKQTAGAFAQSGDRPTAFAANPRAGATVPVRGGYELHVGTFTREGTWAAAARELPRLAADGINVIEMMPVAEFPGAFGWGYDGVFLFAPTRLYGAPDDLRRFVDRAHAVGIGVILDVVYNHLGPDGCVLRHYAPEYFTDRYANEWGDAVNFDGDRAEAV